MKPIGSRAVQEIINADVNGLGLPILRYSQIMKISKYICHYSVALRKRKSVRWYHHLLKAAGGDSKALSNFIGGHADFMHGYQIFSVIFKVSVSVTIWIQYLKVKILKCS